MLTIKHRPPCIKHQHQTLRSRNTSSPVIVHRSRTVTNTTETSTKSVDFDPTKKKINKRLAEEKITFPCTPVAFSSNLFQQFQNQTVERDFNVFKVQYEQKLLQEWKEVSALREHAAQFQKARMRKELAKAMLPYKLLKWDQEAIKKVHDTEPVPYPEPWEVHSARLPPRVRKEDMPPDWKLMEEEISIDWNAGGEDPEQVAADLEDEHKPSDAIRDEMQLSNAELLDVLRKQLAENHVETKPYGSFERELRLQNLNDKLLPDDAHETPKDKLEQYQLKTLRQAQKYINALQQHPDIDIDDIDKEYITEERKRIEKLMNKEFEELRKAEVGRAESERLQAIKLGESTKYEIMKTRDRMNLLLKRIEALEVKLEELGEIPESLWPLKSAYEIKEFHDTERLKKAAAGHTEDAFPNLTAMHEMSMEADADEEAAAILERREAAAAKKEEGVEEDEEDEIADPLVEQIEQENEELMEARAKLMETREEELEDEEEEEAELEAFGENNIREEYDEDEMDEDIDEEFEEEMDENELAKGQHSHKADKLATTKSNALRAEEEEEAELEDLVEDLDDEEMEDLQNDLETEEVSEIAQQMKKEAVEKGETAVVKQIEKAQALLEKAKLPDQVHEEAAESLKEIEELEEELEEALELEEEDEELEAGEAHQGQALTKAAAKKAQEVEDEEDVEEEEEEQDEEEAAIDRELEDLEEELEEAEESPQDFVDKLIETKLNKKIDHIVNSKVRAEKRAARKEGRSLQEPLTEEEEAMIKEADAAAKEEDPDALTMKEEERLQALEDELVDLRPDEVDEIVAEHFADKNDSEDIGELYPALQSDPLVAEGSPFLDSEDPMSPIHHTPEDVSKFPDLQREAFIYRRQVMEEEIKLGTDQVYEEGLNAFTSSTTQSPIKLRVKKPKIALTVKQIQSLPDSEIRRYLYTLDKNYRAQLRDEDEFRGDTRLQNLAEDIEKDDITFRASKLAEYDLPPIETTRPDPWNTLITILEEYKNEFALLTENLQELHEDLEEQRFADEFRYHSDAQGRPLGTWSVDLFENSMSPFRPGQLVYSNPTTTDALGFNMAYSKLLSDYANNVAGTTIPKLQSLDGISYPYYLWKATPFDIGPPEQQVGFTGFHNNIGTVKEMVEADEWTEQEEADYQRFVLAAKYGVQFEEEEFGTPLDPALYKKPTQTEKTEKSAETSETTVAKTEETTEGETPEDIEQRMTESLQDVVEQLEELGEEITEEEKMDLIEEHILTEYDPLGVMEQELTEAASKQLTDEWNAVRKVDDKYLPYTEIEDADDLATQRARDEQLFYKKQELSAKLRGSEEAAERRFEEVIRPLAQDLLETSDKLDQEIEKTLLANLTIPQAHVKYSQPRLKPRKYKTTFLEQTLFESKLPPAVAELLAEVKEQAATLDFVRMTKLDPTLLTEEKTPQQLNAIIQSYLATRTQPTDEEMADLEQRAEEIFGKEEEDEDEEAGNGAVAVGEFVFEKKQASEVAENTEQNPEEAEEDAEEDALTDAMTLEDHLYGVTVDADGVEIEIEPEMDLEDEEEEELLDLHNWEQNTPEDVEEEDMDELDFTPFEMMDGMDAFVGPNHEEEREIIINEIPDEEKREILEYQLIDEWDDMDNDDDMDNHLADFYDDKVERLRTYRLTKLEELVEPGWKDDEYVLYPVLRHPQILDTEFSGLQAEDELIEDENGVLRVNEQREDFSLDGPETMQDMEDVEDMEEEEEGAEVEEEEEEDEIDFHRRQGMRAQEEEDEDDLDLEELVDEEIQHENEMKAHAKKGGLEQDEVEEADLVEDEVAGEDDLVEEDALGENELGRKFELAEENLATEELAGEELNPEEAAELEVEEKKPVIDRILTERFLQDTDALHEMLEADNFKLDLDKKLDDMIEEAEDLERGEIEDEEDEGVVDEEEEMEEHANYEEEPAEDDEEAELAAIDAEPELTPEKLLNADESVHDHLAVEEGAEPGVTRKQVKAMLLDVEDEDLWDGLPANMLKKTIDGTGYEEIKATQRKQMEQEAKAEDPLVQFGWHKFDPEFAEYLKQRQQQTLHQQEVEVKYNLEQVVRRRQMKHYLSMTPAQFEREKKRLGRVITYRLSILHKKNNKSDLDHAEIKKYEEWKACLDLAQPEFVQRMLNATETELEEMQEVAKADQKKQIIKQQRDALKLEREKQGPFEIPLPEFAASWSDDDLFKAISKLNKKIEALQTEKALNKEEAYDLKQYSRMKKAIENILTMTTIDKATNYKPFLEALSDEQLYSVLDRLKDHIRKFNHRIKITPAFQKPIAQKYYNHLVGLRDAMHKMIHPTFYKLRNQELNERYGLEKSMSKRQMEKQMEKAKEDKDKELESEIKLGKLRLVAFDEDTTPVKLTRQQVEQLSDILPRTHDLIRQLKCTFLFRRAAEDANVYNPLVNRLREAGNLEALDAVSLSELMKDSDFANLDELQYVWSKEYQQKLKPVVDTPDYAKEFPDPLMKNDAEMQKKFYEDPAFLTKAREEEKGFLSYWNQVKDTVDLPEEEKKYIDDMTLDSSPTQELTEAKQRKEELLKEKEEIEEELENAEDENVRDEILNEHQQVEEELADAEEEIEALTTLIEEQKDINEDEDLDAELARKFAEKPRMKLPLDGLTEFQKAVLVNHQASFGGSEEADQMLLKVAKRLQEYNQEKKKAPAPAAPSGAPVAASTSTVPISGSAAPATGASTPAQTSTSGKVHPSQKPELNINPLGFTPKGQQLLKELGLTKEDDPDMTRRQEALFKKVAETASNFLKQATNQEEFIPEELWDVIDPKNHMLNLMELKWYVKDDGLYQGRRHILEKKLKEEQKKAVMSASMRAQYQALGDAVKPQKLNLEYPFQFTFTRRTHIGNTKDEKMMDKKVVLRVKVGALNLPPAARDRLIKLAGRRYRERTDTLKLVMDKFSQKQHNTYGVKKLFADLLDEAWKADPNYVPLEQAAQPQLVHELVRKLHNEAKENKNYFVFNTAYIPILQNAPPAVIQ